MERTLCKESDQTCEEEGYPNPDSICEQEGLVTANDEDCEEYLCSTIEFEIACDEMAEVLCRAEVSLDPLPEICAERNEAQCGQTTSCKWLIPDPWACAEPEELLPAAGCFAMYNCISNADCGMNEECRLIVFGSCDEPGDVCEACADYQNLCLPL